MMRRLAAGITFILAAIWLIYLIAGNRQPSEYKCADCNVVLISIDTLRADHLGCYGYGHNTTPHIDALSKDSALFQTAIAQAPSTAPSHGSIFTSLIPSVHGGLFSRKQALAPNAVTIAELLKNSGFRTASFNGGAQINALFGFNRGFEIYDSYSAGDYEKEFLRDRSASAIAWLEGVKAEKFFLFLHSYEVHHPYSPAEKYLSDKARKYSGSLPRAVSPKLLRSINKGKTKISSEDKEYIVELYDAELRSMDEGFQSLIDYLKRENLYDKTLIIVTSDHGEEFDEHGSMGWHSHTLYDELLKVPLILKLPHSVFASRKIDIQVRSLDIAPTILDVLALPAPAHYQGRSLIPLMQGETDFDPFAPAQKDSKNPSPPAALRTAKWKLNMKRLFDLYSDPLETKNVAEENEEAVTGLRKSLERFTSHHIGEAAAAEVDEATIEQLKTLGYLD